MTPDEIGGAIIVGGTVASCMTLAVLAAAAPQSTALVSSGMLGVSAAGAPKVGALSVTAAKVGALGLVTAGIGIGFAGVGLLVAGSAFAVYKIVRK